ncbi:MULTISPECIES: hydroxymethylbilane synthase [Calditerrivibrio]|uniref:hydroxymethylbilane synthase n=1 Tax=Calditerrivibrio TaxID=545865 RepID=UPI003C78F4B1
MEKVTIATRGSKLALWQANHIKSLLTNRYPEMLVDLKIIKTQGDIILDVPLAKIGGKGLFVKEIENALIENEADLAVHSMKDVPVELPDELEIYVNPHRESPFDAFLSVKYNNLDELPRGAKLGTSSLRRKVQISRIRPDIEIVDLRGNVDTRIRKLTEGTFDAIILARAGLNRLNLLEWVKYTFDDSEIIPSVCQGTLGIEVRKDDDRIKNILKFMKDEKTEVVTRAERAFLRRLEGGCQAPIGGYCKIEGGRLKMIGFLSSLDGEEFLKYEEYGDMDKPEVLGESVAEKILINGGKKILDDIYARS